jgi:Tfp pilus assembly protein PilO
MDIAVIIAKIKQNLLSLAILIIAVIIAFKIYQGKENTINALISQREMEKKKNEVLTEISNLEKRLAYLNENVNNKAPSMVLDKISDLAKSASVKISKIIPQKEIFMGAYTRYPYEITLSANDYHQIGKFISSLENSPDIYIIQNLVINTSAAGETNSVNATLTVYTIIINK